MAMKIRKDDEVVVTTGDDKGVRAKVLRVLPEKNKVVVEGVNRVYRHLKPSAQNRQGGRLSKEMPISVSNVMFYCPNCGRGTRIGVEVATDDSRYEIGQKYRVCRACGTHQGTIGSPKPQRVRPAEPKPESSATS